MVMDIDCYSCSGDAKKGMIKSCDELLWVEHCSNCNYHVEYPVNAQIDVLGDNSRYGVIIEIVDRQPKGWNEEQGEVDYSMFTYTIEWSNGEVQQGVIPESIRVIADLKSCDNIIRRVE